MLNNFEFHSPQFLWLLVLIPLLAVWFFSTHKKESATLTISSIKGFSGNYFLPKLKPLLNILRLLALGLLIVALARPRNVEVSKKIKKTKGIDIVMAIDVSGSMMAKDLMPNRLEALKKVAVDFVDRRPNDRIGVVLFAGESFTKVPLTSDASIVKRTISEINWVELYDYIDGGTAIGAGLGSAINRLKESKAKSKVIILLTDGVNDRKMDPKTVSELAKALGIKVYTIGMGTNGYAEFPVAWGFNGELRYEKRKVTIDEPTLKHIAKETGGRYFRATNNKKLKAIYNEINKLEKTEINEYKYYNYTEQYRLLVIFAGVLLLIEFVLRKTVFKSFV